MVDGAEALHRGGMGEHTPAVDIADGVDAGHGGLHIVIDGDASLPTFYAEGLEVQTVGVRRASRSDEHHVSIDMLVLVLLREDDLQRPVGVLFYRLHRTLHKELRLHLLAQAFRDVAVEYWEALFQELHHRHFRAEAAEARCELHAYDPRPDDAEAARRL